MRECPSLSPIFIGEKGLLKVSVNSMNLEEAPLLVAGLKILNKSDPSVDVYTEANGDIILSTCGQVHLERGITDLEKHMCRIKIKQSDPIV